MAITPYTEKQLAENRGPSDSEAYNTRVEQNYRDLTYLYNAVEQTRNNANYAYSALFKQQISLSTKIDQFEDRIRALEQANKTVVFYANKQLDVARFDSTPFKLTGNVDLLTYQTNFGVLTLPYVADSSLSKIKYFNSDGTFNVANGLEVLVIPDNTTADNTTASVETSSPYDAVQAKPGMVWERNVIANTANANGAKCDLFIRIPNDLSVTGSTNGIILYPYPIFDMDIHGVYYSTDPNVALSNNTTWTAINSSQWHLNNVDAVGYTTPGGWVGDAALDAGPKLFYFEPKAITALKITIGQNSYFTRSNKYLYPYGFSDIDIRYDKFLPTGKTIVKLDAPSTDTISKIVSVSPKIWNVSLSQLPDVFSYRVIWETSFGSGNYTTTPVPNSKRVWLEITLNQVTSGFTPSLSSVIVTYT